jgi:cell division protein FtsB
MSAYSDDSFFKNVARYIYHRKKFFLYLVVLLAILAYAVFGKKGILQRVELELENRELERKLKEEQERTLMLQKELEDLRNSYKKIEKVAREKYGMTKDGEEIYKVEVDSTK